MLLGGLGSLPPLASASPLAEPPRAMLEPMAGSERVAVVGRKDDELTGRLVAELRFLGFSPEVMAPPSDPGPSPLVELARARGVAAAVAVDVDGGRVQVWIVDRMTGKLVARELVLSPEAGEAEPREIAVRAVELLRASLVEVEHAPSPPEAEVPVPPAARRALRRPRPRLGLGAGVAVGGAPGGLGVAAHGRAFLRYMPHPRIGVLLSGTAPLHAAEVTAPEGVARIRTGWLGVGPRVGLRPPDATVVPDLFVTAGAALVGMEGIAAPSPRGTHQGTHALVVDAIFEGGAGLEVAVSPRIRLRFEAAAGVCARTVRVRFSGRPVASWCRPHALGSAGIGVLAW